MIVGPWRFGVELTWPAFRVVVCLFGLLIGIRAEAAMPRRLVIAVDGVPFRDMEALQHGITYRNSRNKTVFVRAFHRGYFPATRVVSTYPSASDVAWTDVFHGKPLPGYQRTYYNHAANRKIVQNGVTTTMEYEHEMDWQEPGGFHRTMGYVRPLDAFKREIRELEKHFLNATNHDETFYVLMRSTDDAQHLAGDILELMVALDRKVEEIRAEYRRREGRELELVLMSDHGNNHAGAGRRVEVVRFLERAGFKVGKSINNPEDVVLPTAGIETWVELHNHPESTQRLVELLSHLKGVDVVTGLLTNGGERFLVMNAKGESADILQDGDLQRFAYRPIQGDPLGYTEVLESLRRNQMLDAEGFASADAWLRESVTHRYPAAPERIVRGHTRATQNNATIIISLDNRFVHSAYLIKKGSEFVKFGGTHGGMDSLNCTGMLVSNIRPGEDTLTRHVQAFFDGFPGRRDYRAFENGAEWVKAERDELSPRLRVWSPLLAESSNQAPVEIVIKSRSLSRGRSFLVEPDDRQQTAPLLPYSDTPMHGQRPSVRDYAMPDGLQLEPSTEYRASLRIRAGEKSREIRVDFCTDQRGVPVGY